MSEDGDKEQWRAPTWASFNLTDIETGEPYSIRPNLATVRILAEVAEKWGIAQAADLLLFGVQLVKRETSDLDRDRLQLMIDSVLRSPIGESEDLEEFALWRSYTWLSDKQIDRQQAAQFASDVLGRPISKEAWRKAVDRWAEKQHFPKLKLRGKD